jgi:tetratricopeptide (TPR) repeat protein
MVLLALLVLVKVQDPDSQAVTRWEELNEQILKANRQGDYSLGLERARKANEYAERYLGVEHLNTLTSLHNLAALYQAQGRYGEAEPLFQKTLQLHEKILGSEHPHTLISLHSLAFLYQAQGRYGGAEPLYRKALQLREKVLGPEHPHTLTSLNNLAILYQDLGRYGEVEPLYRKALQLQEKVLGVRHEACRWNGRKVPSPIQVGDESLGRSVWWMQARGCATKRTDGMSGKLHGPY